MSLEELAQMNWELCIAYLDDCIRELQEVRIKLEKALELKDEISQVSG